VCQSRSACSGGQKIIFPGSKQGSPKPYPSCRTAGAALAHHILLYAIHYLIFLNSKYISEYFVLYNFHYFPINQETSLQNFQRLNNIKQTFQHKMTITEVISYRKVRKYWLWSDDIFTKRPENNNNPKIPQLYTESEPIFFSGIELKRSLIFFTPLFCKIFSLVSPNALFFRFSHTASVTFRYFAISSDIDCKQPIYVYVIATKNVI